MHRLDIDKARASMSPSIGYWRDLGVVPKTVAPTEVVRRIAGGQQDARSGVLVLTDQRLLFIAGRRVRWSATRLEMRQATCDYGEMFATVTVPAAGSVFQVRFVDSRDATALVTAAGGQCRRLPRELAIVC